MGKWKFWSKQGVTPKERITAQRQRESPPDYAPPRFLLWLWPFLDRILSKWLSIKPLREDKIGIISIELRRHRSQSVRLDDGTIITPGDLLIELHMNNAWFLHNRRRLTDSVNEVFWRVASAFAEDLRYLARQLAEGRFAADANALHGITMLHSPARRLGFTIMELPNSLRRRLTTFYLNGLRQIYYFREGKEYRRQRKPPALNEVWMSKSRLFEKYRPQ